MYSFPDHANPAGVCSEMRTQNQMLLFCYRASPIRELLSRSRGGGGGSRICLAWKHWSSDKETTERSEAGTDSTKNITHGTRSRKHTRNKAHGLLITSSGSALGELRAQGLK